jgi:hypothetical protein
LYNNSALYCRLIVFLSATQTSLDDGYEQLISNGGRFKTAFAERDKKQSMTDLRGIPTNWFKNQFCPSTKLSRLRFPVFVYPPPVTGFYSRRLIVPVWFGLVAAHPYDSCMSLAKYSEGLLYETAQIIPKN